MSKSIWMGNNLGMMRANPDFTLSVAGKVTERLTAKLIDKK